MTIAAHPRAVADAADGTVISIITEDNGVRNVFRGKDGFLSGDVRGKLFIEMSTLQPMTGRELAPLVEAAGAKLIDSPVLGTIPSVQDGKLFAMVGGKAEDLDAARPVLEKLTRKIVHMGANGAGYAMKLAVNLGLAAFIQATGESLALGTREGLSVPQMLDVLGEAPTANGWFAAKKKLLCRRARRRHARSEDAAQGHDVGGRDRRAGRHRDAAVVRRADRAVGRGGAGLGRQGHRRAGAVFPRADGAEVHLSPVAVSQRLTVRLRGTSGERPGKYNWRYNVSAGA